MAMRKPALLAAVLVGAFGTSSASAHNAGHINFPDGRCLDVGSNKEAPIVAAPAPGNLATGQLDLIPGSGDQYGARFAATRGNSRVEPGECPA
jgi:hypothetical protein